MAKTSMKIKQQREPKFSTRAYNRCKICGRPHAYLRNYGICRICFRELAYEGHYRWDLMRTNNLLGDRKLGAIDKSRWNLPVSDYEIRISDGKIKQNTGFN